MKVKILIASKSGALRTAGPDYTVEAEYGEVCVAGSLGTLAHHGKRSANPCPCLAPNGVFGVPEAATAEDVSTSIGVSHFDLDTLGGILAIMGTKPEVPGFWELAAFIDTKGSHRIHESGASEENIKRLFAWWAWAESMNVYPPQDGSVLDITDNVRFAAAALQDVLKDTQQFIDAGERFRNKESTKNRNSFVEQSRNVIVRVYPGFTNHLYTSPDGVVCASVVAFNTYHGSITVSFAEEGLGNAQEIVQDLWPQKDAEGNFLAGGHKSIAGSPRDKRMTLQDLLNAQHAVQQALNVLVS